LAKVDSNCMIFGDGVGIFLLLDIYG